jgi:hypothetical protein
MPIAHVGKCAISKSPKEVARMTKKPAAKKPAKPAAKKAAPKKGK